MRNHQFECEFETYRSISYMGVTLLIEAHSRFLTSKLQNKDFKKCSCAIFTLFFLIEGNHWSSNYVPFNHLIKEEKSTSFNKKLLRYYHNDSNELFLSQWTHSQSLHLFLHTGGSKLSREILNLFKKFKVKKLVLSTNNALKSPVNMHKYKFQVKGF